jgi:SOS-response transcriptional repressor LexA
MLSTRTSTEKVEFTAAGAIVAVEVVPDKTTLKRGESSAAEISLVIEKDAKATAKINAKQSNVLGFINPPYWGLQRRD